MKTILEKKITKKIADSFMDSLVENHNLLHKVKIVYILDFFINYAILNMVFKYLILNNIRYILCN
jgi:hypothetical protein